MSNEYNGERPHENNDKRRGLAVSRRKFMLATGAVGFTAVAGGVHAKEDELVYAYANWGDSTACSLVGASIISQYFGYKVKPFQADVAVCYTALQSGQADCYSTVYLEGKGALEGGEIKGGHADYVKKIKDSIDFLGISWGPIDQGIAVPNYVNIKTIDDLNANSDKFSGQIVGIDAGSGLMQAADATVKGYDLKLKLLTGSQSAMEAAFRRAYQRKEWIAVTTWNPLPMWAQYEMHYLADPKKLMSQESFYCFHVARHDFKTRFPKAYSFLKKFTIPDDQLSQVMADVDGGTAPQDAATKWVNANKDMVEKWVS